MAQKKLKEEKPYELHTDHPFSSDWSMLTWAMDVAESTIHARHDILRLYDGFLASFPKWQKELDAFKAFRSRMAKILWGLAHIPSGHTEGPLSYRDFNYTRPEVPEPERDFNQEDTAYLIQHLDNNIRRLEGMRGLDVGRNYLHLHESQELNRAKLMRKIVEEWKLYRELSEL